MRIIIQGNAPWVPTGYGVLARNLLPRWKAMGHDLAFFAFHGLYGGQLELDGIPMLPLGKEMWGRDKMEFYSKNFKADIYMTFLDVWAIPEIAKMKDVRWVPYTPIDHMPCPEPVVDVLRGAYRIATMTKNGQKLLEEGKATDGTYPKIQSVPIYHGIDPQFYKPLPLENRQELRKLLNLTDKDFLIGIVAMNKGLRKNFQDMFDVFARFKKRHSNVKLYVHSDSTRPDGMDLRRMAKFFGIENDIFWSDIHLMELGYPPEKVGELYNMFDVTLMTTAGEGFGFPIIESQACGTPVITNDFTTGRELNAIPELVVTPDRLFMDNLLSYQALTDIDKAVEALEQVYMNGKESYAEKLVEFSKQFEWDTIAKQWGMFFNEIEADLGLKKPVIAPVVEGAKPEEIKA